MPDVVGLSPYFGIIPGIAFSVIVGQLAGWVIGKWTEYSTSDEFTPTQKLAEQAETGAATIIIGGIADGMMSVWVPVITVCVAMVAAFGFANGWHFGDVTFFSLGLYGVGIAAVGMLSTLGITLATDAYGPIADNAGGNAEMSGLDPKVRERTDALDSLGNTTAATGKGFAIGSAALTALALLAAYVEQVREGFDRWGSAAVTQQADAEYIKASPQFIVRNLKEKDKDGNPKHQGLLLLTGHRDDNWRNTPINSDVTSKVTVDAAAGTITFDVGEADEKKTVMQYVDRAEATLPDFMSYYDASLMNPRVLVGVFLGAMATFCVLCPHDESRRPCRQGHGRGSAAPVQRETRHHEGHGRTRLRATCRNQYSFRPERNDPADRARSDYSRRNRHDSRCRRRDRLARWRSDLRVLHRRVHGQRRWRLGQRQEVRREWRSRRQVPEERQGRVCRSR